jgi:hypothetical protein
MLSFSNKSSQAAAQIEWASIIILQGVRKSNVVSIILRNENVEKIVGYGGED